MALLDGSIYDLSKIDEQRQAIEAIIGEHNRQFDNAAAYLTYQIVAYTELTITTVADLVSKIYTQSYRHGLGYAPLVLSLRKDPSGFSTMPFAGFNPTVGPPASTNTYLTTNAQNLYFNVSSDGTTEVTEQAGFYIFSLPAQV